MRPFKHHDKFISPDGRITLYHGDCMDLLAACEVKEFDLAVVDVNYGIQQDGRNNHSRSKLAKAKDYRNRSRYDDESPEQPYFEMLFDVTRNRIVWGANHFISKIPFDASCWIVWDKDNGRSDFADCELAWTSFDTAVRIFTYKWQGMLQGNMKNKENRIHPNQKPIALYRWLLQNYAQPEYTILDTHLGSASSAIASHRFGCKFVGIEKDEDYYKDAVKRFKEQTAQKDLEQEIQRIKAEQSQLNG